MERSNILEGNNISTLLSSSIYENRTSLQFIGLWFLSSTFCNFRHTGTIHVLLDLYLSISCSLKQFYMVLFLFIFIFFGFQLCTVSTQKNHWFCVLISDPLLLWRVFCTFFEIFCIDNVIRKQKIFFLFKWHDFYFPFLVYFTD